MQGFNLGLQIMIGFLQQNLMLVSAIAVALVVLYGLLLVKKLGFTKGAIKNTVLAGIAAWVLFIFTLPSMTMSSLAQVEYITDWVMLSVMSLGYAGVVAVLLYPLFRMKQAA
ncbi:MAG: hypothetical protein JXR44_07170 [Thiotrichales bacterium]|nr:hypothetical protein [Thiotrichales bacterium]